MTNSAHITSSLNLYSSLYETSLKLLTLSLIMPLPKTQMFVENKQIINQNSDHESNFSNVLNIRSKELATTDTNFKEYQTLLDRFRRKTTSDDTLNVNGSLSHSNLVFETNKHNKIQPTLDIDSAYDKNNSKIDNDSMETKNSSMQKLRVDDTTLTKIFHDFSSTVKKNKNESSNEFNYVIGDFEEIIDNLINKKYPNDTSLRNITDKPLNLTHVLTPRRFPEVSNFVTTGPSYNEDGPGTQSKRIISILGLFELSVGDSPRTDGVSELAAAKLAVEHVNSRAILPGYKLHLVTNDTKCDPGVGVDRFFHALYTKRESRMVMLLGTACSEVTESIAKIVPYWNIVQVSFGSTSPVLSDRSEFPLFCRTVAPDSSHNPARIAFIRQFGWDTVTAFSQNEEVYSLAVNELVTQLEAANITCAASITFAETDFKEQLQQLKRLDTRIIIGSFSQDMIPKIFCEAFRLGMFGAEYAWLVAGSPPRIQGTAPCARAHLARALEGLVSVTAYRGIVGDLISSSGLTNEMFNQELEAAASGVPVSPYAPQTYDAVWAIALALSKAEQQWRQHDQIQQNQTTHKLELWHFDYDRKDMAEEFLNQLSNLSFLGISGPVSFNGADRIGTSAFYQIQEGAPRTVALYIHGREMECVECARPQWAGGVPAAKRVLVLRVDSVWAPARLAVAILAAAGVALALSFLAFNLHYSKRRSIKLSSPRLNNMTLIGCVLVYTAVALLGVDNATLPSYIPFSAMCISRVYILSAGFSLAFGSMFAKTYRVHRIFISNRSGVCKTKLLQDTPLIFLVCALLLIDGMIVTLWAALDPMERHLKNLTIEISATDRSVTYQPQIEVCKSQNTAGWLCALYAYKGLLLIVGVYMAWETRNVKISALNDSKYIGISVYSVVITSASVVVIGTIISERATLAYITITSLILITTTSTLCLLFLPKIIAIRSNAEEDPVTQSLGLRLECNTRRFVTDETQELHFRIEIQNKVYRREVAALDKEIGRLERLLAEPLESATGSTASITLHSNRSGVCKTKLLQDTPLIFLVCALLLIDGMIVTLWAALDPMERHLKNLTIEISATDRSVTYQPQIEVCKSQNTAGWLCALYAYKGLLLIVGVYMAWETRNVKISALNDSKYIGISVYSVVITSASVVVIGTIISERATLAYITITSLILITTTSTLCLLFLPKIIAIRSNAEEDPVTQSLGLRLECNTRRFVTDETQELHFRIEIQNKVYRREVAALDKEIGRLERLLAEPLESATGSTASITLHRRTELNIVEEEGKTIDSDRRTPSISGGLPMLLLSVLPPVIPRASWPSAEAFRGRNSVSFSSQPKLNYRKSQPAIDLYNLCLNKRDEQPGFLSRLKSFFGSRPSSRKASTMSIADPTGQSIAAALRMHVGMIAGLVPGNRKHSMVLSCNTLHVPNPELKLRRESYSRSGPIIRVTDDEPSCSNYVSDASLSSGTQKYIAEPETKVNFVLPETHNMKSMSHQNSFERIRGSPRFPHRISPTTTATTSLTTLDNRRKTSADSVFSISGRVYDEQRRYSHQNVGKQETKVKVILENRWKSTEDARPGPSSRH